MFSSVLDLLTHAFRSSRGNNQQFKDNVLKALIGSVVLTRYNNKTYRIDDVDFNQSPLTTFKCKDRSVSYQEYYKIQYDITLKDMKQPLLISRAERTVSGRKEKETLTFALVPEICFLTGLTDEQRADFKVNDFLLKQSD